MKQKLLLIITVLLTAIKANAYDFEVDGIYYEIISVPELTCKVTNKDEYYNSYSGEIVIPSNVTYRGRNFTVIEIGSSAFSRCTGLSSVLISNSVQKIGAYAFYNCTRLTSVMIPNSVNSIENHAFSYCDKLSSFVIPNSVTYIGKSAFEYCHSLNTVVIPNSMTSIGEAAFLNCTGLTSVVIPISVQSISNGAFGGCSNLTSVEIPNSVSTIGDYAFSGCSSLTSVAIPNSVTTIGDGAFNLCVRLTSVEIPNSVTEIGYNTFYNCSSLTSAMIPKSVTTIGKNSFTYCHNLKSVEIPNSVTSIGDCAFMGCSSLTSVVIPNSVTEIGVRTFGDCKSITSVIIGNSVTSIGGYAFSSCTSIKEIYSLSVNPPKIESTTFEQDTRIDVILKVTFESVLSYMNSDYWKDFWNIVAINGIGENPETKQCVAPEISIVEGKLVAISQTEGSKCYTSITTDDYKGYDGNDPISLSGVYTITSFAHAEGYQNSETVTATLVWVNPTLEGSSILTMEAKKAVLIRANGGEITVSGTERGERISLYTIDGREILTAKTDDGETNLPCRLNKGEVVIVRYGGKSVKIAI